MTNKPTPERVKSRRLSAPGTSPIRLAGDVLQPTKPEYFENLDEELAALRAEAGAAEAGHVVADPHRGGYDRSIPVDQVKSALAVFFEIARKWKLESAQVRILLGEPTVDELDHWRRLDQGHCPNRDTVERISYMLGIFGALEELLPPDQADSWIHRPNEAFGGRTALEHMLGGNVVDLAEVRAYLDAVVQG